MFETIMMCVDVSSTSALTDTARKCPQMLSKKCIMHHGLHRAL